MKTLLLACVGAFCAAFGFAFSATAAETIAYWPFGTNGFHDVSGNGHDLVGVEISESDAAYMVLNEGTTTGQYLKTAEPLDLSGETAVTFECWWRKTTAYKSEYPMLMATAHTGANDLGGFIVCQYANADGVIRSQYRCAASSWQLDYTNEKDPMFVGGKVNDDMWHHVAYVINRSETTKAKQCRLYVDGLEVAISGTWGTIPDVVAALFNDYFVIGGGTDYSSLVSWHGYIDDVRISRGVLSPDEFLKYPTVGKAMRADDGKLPVVAYWPFGGKRGKDATGNGFDLTMSGVPMTVGTPSPSYTDYAKTNYYNGNFPFSVFSKTGFTLECYAKSSSGSDSAGSLVETTTTYYNNTGAFQLRFEPNYRTVTAYFLASGKEGSNPKYVKSPTSEEMFGALNDGKWRHYAVVYDPSKKGAGIVTLYVDGVAAPVSADVSDQGAFALLDTKLYIARRDIGSSRGSAPFYGSLDDVRITAGVLTPDQFLPVRSVNSIVALYRFDRETLADQSGNGNDLAHCQDASVAGSPTFGDGGYAESGTGLVLSGNNGTKDWVKTASTLDLSGTKAVTFEIDYNSEIPSGSGNYFLVGSENPLSANGNVTYLDAGKNIHGQTRKADGSGWRNLPGVVTIGSATNGYQRVRYVVNGNNVGTSYYTLNVDGTYKAANDTLAIAGLGNQALCMGHSPNYVQAYWMKGKILRVAVSDQQLAATEFVLDNLVLDTPKATLAYWDFNGFSDKSGAGNDLIASGGCQQRRGALLLDGASSAETEDTLYLSELTQATIECFVCFGETPSSGTLFSLGSGVGSFAVAADATAGTLTGSFIPYDHLAASNGGASELATLAGKPKNMAAWHHVALVIDRTKSGADAVRFYVDYERATPAGRAWDAAATMLDGTLVVGADSTQADGFFTGYIDDLRVSKGALEPSEFLQPSEHTYVPDGMSILIR